MVNISPPYWPPPSKGKVFFHMNYEDPEGGPTVTTCRGCGQEFDRANQAHAEVTLFSKPPVAWSITDQSIRKTGDPMYYCVPCWLGRKI